MLSKIYNLLKYCYEDSIVDKFSGLEFQLFIISAKSLIPYENKIGCMFDEQRYRMEMEVFPYYKNGKDEVVDYYINNKTHSSIDDKLIEYKILPGAISNSIYPTLLEESLKTAFFYTTCPLTIIKCIIVSSAIFEYFNEETFDLESLNNKTKDRLICFSLKNFLENNVLNTDKSLLINFEKERIKIILNDNIFSDDIINCNRTLQYIINNNKSVKTTDNYNDALLNNFAAYILKLRKGTLNPEKLKYSKDNINDFKMYLKNPEFVHPLLGKCVIVRKNDKEIIIKNKTGLLRVNL